MGRDHDEAAPVRHESREIGNGQGLYGLEESVGAHGSSWVRNVERARKLNASAIAIDPTVPEQPAIGRQGMGTAACHGSGSRASVRPRRAWMLR
ncbi:hypothetical protein GCM10008965_41470 [Methylorubrum aminovorans]|nr:hypothetical protein GCM10025880_40010 [Methylorubrum aminovorans]